MDHHEDENRAGAENRGKHDDEVRLVYLLLKANAL
jgi:hypothetical protein